MLAFDDYERQPLLPAKHSQLGPGHAWGDIDGDGDDDLFLGGPKGAASRLYLRDKEQFVNAPFDKDATSEDMAPIFFDANGDGDLDLYVVSGGVECEPGGAVLQDRLYFNDGKGSFRKTPNALPKFKQSGSVVCAADYDHDGDVDLFVGGRVVPGRYPDSPLSKLLEYKHISKMANMMRMAIVTSGMSSPKKFKKSVLSMPSISMHLFRTKTSL